MFYILSMELIDFKQLQALTPRITKVCVGGLFMVGFYFHLDVKRAGVFRGNTLTLQTSAGEILVSVGYLQHTFFPASENEKASIHIKTVAKYSEVHGKKPETVVVYLD